MTLDVSERILTEFGDLTAAFDEELAENNPSVKRLKLLCARGREKWSSYLNVKARIMDDPQLKVIYTATDSGTILLHVSSPKGFVHSDGRGGGRVSIHGSYSREH